ncbi:MAG: hypothetical protein JWQ16_601 [Novosphingobium sp.]|nr:hypothetical protein [Novosphingobium sp.]
MKHSNARRTSRRLSRHQSVGAIFAAPLAICVLGAIGLVSALTGDGWRDALAWAGLAAPIVAVAWAMLARRT